VLITEQEVKMLTAATIAAAPHAGPGLIGRWIAASRAAREAHGSHRPYIAHYEFLENAAMARAMERL
jgi:hypothetical protein